MCADLGTGDRMPNHFMGRASSVFREGKGASMNPTRLPRLAILLVALLALASIPAFAGAAQNTPAAPGGPLSQQNSSHSYRVNGVASQSARSAIARIGAAIDQVGPDFVVVTA